MRTVFLPPPHTHTQIDVRACEMLKHCTWIRDEEAYLAARVTIVTEGPAQIRVRLNCLSKKTYIAIHPQSMQENTFCRIVSTLVLCHLANLRRRRCLTHERSGALGLRPRPAIRLVRVSRENEHFGSALQQALNHRVHICRSRSTMLFSKSAPRGCVHHSVVFPKKPTARRVYAWTRGSSTTGSSWL